MNAVMLFSYQSRLIRQRSFKLRGWTFLQFLVLKALKLDYYFLNGLKYPETWLKPRFPKVLRIEDRELQIEDQVSMGCQITIERYSIVF